MVYYYMNSDPDVTRNLLTSLRDLGCTQPLALIYWWQHETRGNDQYLREMGYNPNIAGDAFLTKLDNFINIAHELGMRPSLRLGEMHKGQQWHPGDADADIHDYADWIHRIATRYRGKVDHYVLIDEMNKGNRGVGGRADRYVNEVVIPISEAIRSADPDAGIGSTSVSSAPATPWQLEMIEHGLPRYADGVTCNIDSRHTELRSEFVDFMRQIKAVWPQAKFYSNGVGYVEQFPAGQEAIRAATLAQTMFTLWDIGYDHAPYYLYRYSMTKDTAQDFGLVAIEPDGTVSNVAPAWYAFQTIAQTFYNRDQMAEPSFNIELIQTQKLGDKYIIAPPDVETHAYIRDGGQLLLYLTYHVVPHQRDGRFNVVLHTDDWGGPQQIPLLDYQGRVDLPHRYDDGRIILENVHISEAPTIITFRKRID
jgi:hypothetical protein